MRRNVRSASLSKAAARAAPVSGPATSLKSTLKLMRATGPRHVAHALLRAALTLVPTLGVLVCLHADTHADVIDLFASMAAALSEINVPQFMDAFDKNMQDYDQIKTGVTALVRQADVTSS